MTNDRLAHSSVPLHDPIAKRWSPRAFTAEAVTREDLTGLLEAARWAPSCFGAEPWRFVVGIKGSGSGHERIAEALVEANRIWAASAPVLMITIARDTFEYNGEPNAWSKHDVGLAMGQLAIEATARGLVVHQMGGFDADKARELLGIPDGFSPIAACAIGHLAPADTLPEDLCDKEAAERARKPLGEIAFEGTFGEAFQG